MDLITTAFQQGCDVPLQNIQKSRRFRAAQRRFSRAPREFRQAGEGSIVDLGLWEFATAVNSLGETNALAMTATLRQQPADPKVMALVESLGEQLIRTSKPGLPASATDAAHKWGTLAAEEQIKLAFAVSKTLRTSAFAPTKVLEDEPTLTITGDEVDEWLEDTTWNDQDCDRYELTGTSDDRILKIWGNTDPDRRPRLGRDYRAEESLPRSFNLTTPTPERPNCLGLAIVLCAFAELTGSEYLLCSHLEHRASQPTLWSALLGSSDARRMHELDIPLGDAFEQQVKRDTMRDLNKWSADEFNDFHYCLVIQLNDQRWLMIDPFQKTVAVLADVYGIDQAKATLRRYANLYPGMTVLADDGGLMTAAVAKLETLTAESSRRTESIMAPLYDVPFSPQMMTQLLDAKVASGDQKRTGYWLPDYISYCELLQGTEDSLWFETEVRGNDGWADCPDNFPVLPFMAEQASSIGIAQTTMGEQLFAKFGKIYQDDLIASSMEDWNPHDYTAKTLKIFTLFDNMLAERIDKLHAAIWSGLDYAHPVIELMNPRFGLALALLNQLSCWTNSKLDGSVLLDYGSSQQYWHEAVDLVDDPFPSEKLEWIETLVRQLPHLYPVVSNKLAFTPQGRKLSNGTRPQRDGHQRRHGGDPAVA